MKTRKAVEPRGDERSPAFDYDDVEVECPCRGECPSYSFGAAATCDFVEASSRMPDGLQGVLEARIDLRTAGVSSLLYRLYVGLTEMQVTFLTYECPVCWHRSYLIEHFDVIDGLVLELAHRGDHCGWE